LIPAAHNSGWIYIAMAVSTTNWMLAQITSKARQVSIAFASHESAGSAQGQRNCRESSVKRQVHVLRVDTRWL
jgi:hypothetical protein